MKLSSLIFLLLLNSCGDGFKVSLTSGASTDPSITCPAGYIPVSGSATFGTSDFCVMQFEAKNVLGLATSQALETPWVSISQVDSKTACTTLGLGYDLISNPEWMTIAYIIEANSSNWDGGVVGTGALFRGHSDSLPLSALVVTDVLDFYNGTGNNSAEAMGSGREQRRTLSLQNGEVIWDFAGNVVEWVDWSVGGALSQPVTSCGGLQAEVSSVGICPGLGSLDYTPANPSLAIPYDKTRGLGFAYAHDPNVHGVLRGGSWSLGDWSGIFSILFNFPEGADTYIGFRCVYRGP